MSHEKKIALIFLSLPVSAVSINDCIEVINENKFYLAKQFGQHQAMGEYLESDDPFRIIVNGIRLEIHSRSKETFRIKYPLYALEVPNICEEGRFVFVEFFYIKSNIYHKGVITNTAEIYCWYDDHNYFYKGSFMSRFIH